MVSQGIGTDRGGTAAQAAKAKQVGNGAVTWFRCMLSGGHTWRWSSRQYGWRCGRCGRERAAAVEL